MVNVDEADLMATGVEWDIDSLVAGEGVEGVERLLVSCEAAAGALDSFRGRVAELSASEMADLMRGVAAVLD